MSFTYISAEEERGYVDKRERVQSRREVEKYVYLRVYFRVYFRDYIRAYFRESNSKGITATRVYFN